MPEHRTVSNVHTDFICYLVLMFPVDYENLRSACYSTHV
jgi:hypothetical protein